MKAHCNVKAITAEICDEIARKVNLDQGFHSLSIALSLSETFTIASEDCDLCWGIDAIKYRKYLVVKLQKLWESTYIDFQARAGFC